MIVSNYKFSRTYCDHCRSETLFCGRKCSTPHCTYSKPNEAEARKAGPWDSQQRKRAEKLKRSK